MRTASFASLLALGFITGLSPASHAQSTTAQSQPQNVAIFVYPGVEPLDLSGPLDVFVKANEISPRSFNVFTVAVSRAPIQTEKGILAITPKYALAAAPRPDIIVVPGSSTVRVFQVGADPRVQNWLRRNATSKQTVMSVCTGAYIVGATGLLNGKKSTTHWFALADFQRKYPKTQAFSGARFVQDGNLLSTAGVSSGIDGALQLVEQKRGKQVADVVARVIQYRRGTPSFPDQRFARVQVQTVSAESSKPRTAQKLALDYDPVCHMKVKSDTPITFKFQGKLYGFCATGCRDAFAAHPEQFLKSK